MANSDISFFFNPKSIAVIGASETEGKVGNTVINNIINSSYNGKIYPINPKAHEICNLTCYKSVLDVPEDIDIAIFVIPGKLVNKAAEECGKKRIKGLIIISAGFKEIGGEGVEREEELIKIGKKYNLRILGPNCLGVYYSKTGMDTLFLPETKVLTTGDEVIATPRPMPGSIAIVTQSGAFGVAALDFLAGRQIGVSKFVSFGNKCDVTEYEMMHYLLYDKETKVILLYVEDIKHGREFLRITKKVTLKKPIVALKAGRSAAGARAAASHTGAIAGADKIYDAAFKQAGVIRARDMEEFFDAGKALTMQPPAWGRKIGVLTDAGGPGIMAVDECESNGLSVERFSEETLQKFQKLKDEGVLPKFAATSNPVDLTGSVTDYMFKVAADIMFQDT